MSPATQGYNNSVAILMAVGEQNSEDGLEWRWVLLMERMTRDGAAVGSLEVRPSDKELIGAKT